MLLEFDSFLTPVLPHEPCGQDPAYEPALMEARRLADGIPEQQVGDSRTDATLADWPKVRANVLSVLAKHRDLESLVLLTRSGLAIDGWSGLRDATELLAGSLRTFWEDLHPQLDGDVDPRRNRLAELNDYRAFVGQLKDAPIVHCERLGDLTLRMVERIQRSESEHGLKPFFEDSTPEQLSESADAVEQSLRHFHDVKKLFEDRVGEDQSIDIGLVSETLKTIGRLLRDHISSDGVSTSETKLELGRAEADNDHVSLSMAASRDRLPADGITSRREVIAALDAICKYYRMSEPASPLPLLLRRAKRLVDKEFLEIVQDLMPKALDDAKLWEGGTDETKQP